MAVMSKQGAAWSGTGLLAQFELPYSVAIVIVISVALVRSAEPFRVIVLCKIAREAVDVFEASVKESDCRVEIEDLRADIVNVLKCPWRQSNHKL